MIHRISGHRILGIGRNYGIARATLGLLLLLGVVSLPPTIRAASPAPLASFSAASVAPRPVEDATSLAIQRDYAHAWLSLVSALEDNHADLLNENFTGNARQQWQDAIHAQQQNGLSRHIVDHGHKVRVTFYSLDGSSLQAIDTADLEIQYREGSKLLSSERIQAHYLVLLTPAENSWKVRILQEVPAS